MSVLGLIIFFALFLLEMKNQSILSCFNTDAGDSFRYYLLFAASFCKILRPVPKVLISCDRNAEG